MAERALDRLGRYRVSLGGLSGASECFWLARQASNPQRLDPLRTVESIRTVRHYVPRQLLVAPEFSGKQTRYDRMNLLRLLVLPMLKAEGVLCVDYMWRVLDELGEVGLPRLVQRRSLPPATRQALGWPVEAAAPPGAAEQLDAASSGTSPANESDPAASQTWQHITLLPGLELVLRADATAFVKDVARQIRQRYATR